MSLYLKYRPQDFGSVVAQDHVTATVQSALGRGTVSHAYLFAGPRGTGKTSLARIIAKAINCESRRGTEPCNACSICQGINQGRLVDLIEIDAASNRGIDEIRELREKIQFAPTRARAKVYIIDEVHMLTKEAFNALLKTLEEPPEHAYFILATTEAHKIPETIVSRCQQFIFRRIDMKGMEERLADIAEKEGIAAEAGALALIAKMANGGLRDAIGLLEQMSAGGAVTAERVAGHLGLSGNWQIETFFTALQAGDARAALSVVEQVNAEGKNLHQFTQEFISLLREQMLISVDSREALPALLEWIDIFSAAKAQISQALIPQLPVEMAVIKACLKSACPPAGRQEAKKVQVPAQRQTSETPVPEALTLERIRGGWEEVASHIETPFIRISFMDGEPQAYERGELTLHFKSDSLMEKVRSKVNQEQIQRAFEKVFATKIRLKTELKKINLKPVGADEKEKSGLAEMAKEVFGD